MAKLDFTNNYILENSRVQLRPLNENDFQQLSTFSLKEPDLWDFSLTPANGLNNLKQYMDMAFSDRKDEKAYPFIVFDKKEQKYAGSTRFYDYQKNHNTVQIGYTWYGKNFQGTGLNKNCKYLLLEFAFEHLKVDRVEFRADNTNKRSIAAMKSLGCTVEGVLRNHCAAVDGRRDSIILSILKDEWFGSVKNNLKTRL